ncbi:MAG: 3-dehydroquinate synthase [Odoribacter sp.]|nr:3-dehydroquinate synthase [Odoribacter sp.]
MKKRCAGLNSAKNGNVKIPVSFIILSTGICTFKINYQKLGKYITSSSLHKSTIVIGEKWTNFRKYIPEGDTVILTDDNILNLYGKDFSDYPVLSITPGEKSKKLSIIDDLAAKLLKLGIDRNGFIIGIGGGVVCDVAGFLGSVYMRGIGFGFVSTSLLSQVDASIGGKNGVNVGSVKNIIGNFRQPEFVICDPEMLKTLPGDEYLSGLAELIKNGVILDADLVTEIADNVDLILKRDTLLLSKLIKRSVDIKASVVREDEKETGIRVILNFGHTFGHAIEAQTGLKHGFAVAAGMIIAADISVRLGFLQPEDRNKLFNLLNSLELLVNYTITHEQVKELISQDKKKLGKSVSFVMLEKTGKAIVKKITVTKLLEYYKSLNSR